MKCINCGIDFVKGVQFKCPNCEKLIARCLKCKKLAVKYRCSCGFEGP
jgi:hypothetical protein